MKIARFALLCSALLAAPLQAQRADATIDAGERRAVINGVMAELRRAYVFPNRAAAMERWVRWRAAGGAYDSITSGTAFADTLTADLQAISHDKHVRVRLSPPLFGMHPDPPTEQDRINYSRARNYGYVRAEVLPGNIGFLRVESFGFNVDEGAREAAAEAMGTVAGARALVIDVRDNGGGTPGMVALLSSYLFGDTAVHLNSVYWRPYHRIENFYTDPFVSGPTFGPDRPVFILTSARTFSAAEEFCYNLQALRRATIVGEVTGGGAHPGAVRRINEHFTVFVPSGLAINPVTGTNWEGTGVLPDVDVSAERALDAALGLATKAVRLRADDPL